MGWAVPAEDGDAVAAVAEIEQWREMLPRAAPQIAGVMDQVRSRLQLLWMSPLVRGDAECLAVFDGMRFCRDMVEFEAAVARLQARVSVLVRAPATPDPTRTPAPAVEPRRAERGVATAWRSILKT